MTAPRLHVILSREAQTGLVIRRGPSKQVLLVGWNRKTDSFIPGQWLKGRIYERRCDLSPDGRHLIYFAMNGKWKGEMGGSWTAVSRPPWLTALHIYGWGDCWNGGGLFTSNTSYWLNGSGGSELPVKLLDCGLYRQNQPPPGVTPGMGEDPVIYFPKLLRDGWKVDETKVDQPDNTTVFTKLIRPGWNLSKTFHSGVGTGPLRQCYWETHSLMGPGGVLEAEGWEWADTDGHDVVFARKGALWRMRIHANSADTPRMLHDFTHMAFEQKEAPYCGISQRGRE